MCLSSCLSVWPITFAEDDIETSFLDGGMYILTISSQVSKSWGQGYMLKNPNLASWT